MRSLGKPIATGRTAEIYAWEDGQVLKLFRDWVPAEYAEGERSIAIAVHAAGLASPWAGEIIEVNGRKGLVYERLDGPSMAEFLSRHLWQVTRLAQQFAELHAAMHQIHVHDPQAPSQRERLVNKINATDALSEKLKATVLKSLAEMPEDDRLCHGDFHPGNILMTTRGPVVIDWIDVTRGHPAADLARSSLIVGNIHLYLGKIGWLFRGNLQRFLRIYQDRYFQLMPVDRTQVEGWLPIIAAARLSENIRQEAAACLAIVKRSFTEN